MIIRIYGNIILFNVISKNTATYLNDEYVTGTYPLPILSVVL